MGELHGDGKASSATHITALDGLRALAILLVIPHNADIFSNSPSWMWPAAILAHAGWIGVQLFFVLSGFLITRNLLDSRNSDNYFGAFYGRRALRILPVYFLTLLVALILLPHFVDFSPGALASHRNQVWLWTFLINWVQPLGVDVSGFSHFWSLAVEEQFYLVWPFIVLLFAGKRFLWACAAFVVVAFATRVALLHFGGNPEMLYMFTVCRMDALALGAAAAALSQSGRCNEWLGRHRNRALLLCAGLLLVTALITHTYAVYDPQTLTIGYPLLAGAFALLILTLKSIQDRRPDHWLNTLLSTPLLRSVGRYSYAMYIFHLPILTLFGASIREAFAFAGAAMPLFYVASAVVLTYGAGFVSYHLVEKHFLRLKYLFSPRMPAALPTQR